MKLKDFKRTQKKLILMSQKKNNKYKNNGMNIKHKSLKNKRRNKKIIMSYYKKQINILKQ